MVTIKEKCHLTFMSNSNMKYRLLTRRKIKMTGRHIHVIHNTATKIIVILTIKNKMK